MVLPVEEWHDGRSPNRFGAPGRSRHPLRVDCTRNGPKVTDLGGGGDSCVDRGAELGAKLASLRDRGVLVLTSGNIVHNLAQMDRKQPDTGYPWVRAFDDAVREAMTSEPGDLPRLQAHQYFSTAVPTPDHFLPVLYIAGLAASEGAAGEVLVDGCAMGSLSMTAYTVGWQGNVSGAAAGVQVLPPIEHG